MVVRNLLTRPLLNRHQTSQALELCLCPSYLACKYFVSDYTHACIVLGGSR